MLSQFEESVNLVEMFSLSSNMWHQEKILGPAWCLWRTIQRSVNKMWMILIFDNDVEQHRRSWPHFALEERIYCPKIFLTLPYNCSSLSCWIKNTFTFYPLPLLPGRRLSQLELHLAMNHRIYLASVKQVLLNTCPKHDEKRLNAMWHSRPRGRMKMNLESPGRGGAGVWVD